MPIRDNALGLTIPHILHIIPPQAPALILRAIHRRRSRRPSYPLSPMACSHIYTPYERTGAQGVALHHLCGARV